jgi:hypothetical protein
LLAIAATESPDCELQGFASAIFPGCRLSGNASQLYTTYYVADEYTCPDCETPTSTNVIVSATGFQLTIGSWYTSAGELGVIYNILSVTTFDDEAIVVNSTEYATCDDACNEGFALATIDNRIITTQYDVNIEIQY